MPVALNAAALGTLPPGVAGPGYDRSEISPGIVHVGVGNFHRAHMAVYLADLMAQGAAHDWGIIGAGVRPGDAAMRERLAGQDWLSSVVTRDQDGATARVPGAMLDYLPVEPRAIAVGMADPRIRIVSLTVTEGGYYIDAATGGFDAGHPDMRADAAAPDTPASVFGIMLKALRLRRDAGLAPFTVLSCDNLPGNGRIARQTVTGLARISDPRLADWVGEHVAFPNSLVDRITPATTAREIAFVQDHFGIADAAPVVCEPFRQWVIQDHFPQGRPALERVGVEFVDDVSRHELMKLRILNASHAGIAYGAALLGHEFVHDAMADPDISAWLIALQTREVIGTLKPIPGVDYRAYLASVVHRFSNPEIGDTIARLAAEGADRQPKFILPTLRDALAAGGPVDGLALEVALWCRYCEGADEAGRRIELVDATAEELQRRARAARERPAAFLENRAVFGDLAQAPRFAAAFSVWLAALHANGARATLRAYCG